MSTESSVERRLVSVGAGDEARNHRLSGRNNSDGTDTRSEAQRDCDRIVYSNAWRRLGAVTQVITPFDDAPVMHNRLTHSEKVARVARGIGERLLAEKKNHKLLTKYGGLDLDVCDAGALAHDLGHPPFGHVGEEILDRVARRETAQNGLGLSDGFEGNAQSIRIATLGLTRSQKYEGFDLTLASLGAIAKYPWTRVETIAGDEEHKQKLREDAEYRRRWRKFNFYNAQKSVLDQIRTIKPDTLGPETQSLEASVMDAADDISYAVHDLEDFYLAGILNMADIRQDLGDFVEVLGPRGNKERPSPFFDMIERLDTDYHGFFDLDQLEEATKRVLSDLHSFRQPVNGDPYSESVARGRGAKMIGEFIGAVQIRDDAPWTGGPHICLEPLQWHQVQVLKVITKQYVISRPDIALIQRGQQNILESLVGLLRAWVDNPDDVKRLPPQLREEWEIAQQQEVELKAGGTPSGTLRGKPYRVILDYLCSLGDQQCVNLYQKLSGAVVHRIGTGVF